MTQIPPGPHDDLDSFDEYGPQEPVPKDLARYWPAFVIGGALAIALGVWALSSIGDDQEVARPTTTASAPATSATPTPEGSTQPAPTTSQETSQAPTTTDDPAQESSDKPTGSTGPTASEDPAPRTQVPVNDSQVLEGKPAPPKEVMGLPLIEVTGGTMSYADSTGPRKVTYVPGMTDDEIAVELGGRPIFSGNWVCDEVEGDMTCISLNGMDGRLKVTGSQDLTELVAFGDAFVQAWG